MIKRLQEQFHQNQPVEIYFERLERWVSGRVVAVNHPGLWIETGTGHHWFVTNPRRIRPRPAPDSESIDE